MGRVIAYVIVFASAVYLLVGAAERNDTAGVVILAAGLTFFVVQLTADVFRRSRRARRS